VLPFADVTPFDPVDYRELDDPPPAYDEYLRSYKKRGRRPRPFGHVPHVLVAAPIDVAGLRLVKGSE
jgi:hypothetical protein